LCALAGCSATRAREHSGKKLLRCGRCRTMAYCCVAHQRSDWARHKPECRKREDDDASSSQQDGEDAE
jgi:hypothetical protein